MVNSDDDVDGDGGDDDDLEEEEKYDEESQGIGTKMYHIFIFYNYHSKHKLLLAKKNCIQQATPMNDSAVANHF